MGAEATPALGAVGQRLTPAHAHPNNAPIQHFRGQITDTLVCRV
jgi:hypothetical protein